jgi:hypothetical protein
MELMRGLETLETNYQSTSLDTREERWPNYNAAEARHLLLFLFKTGTDESTRNIALCKK